MQVVVHTGRKNAYGLNGATVAVKEIVDSRVTVVVPQEILSPEFRRGNGKTRTLDFLPSDIKEYIGSQTFTLTDEEVNAASVPAPKPAAAEGEEPAAAKKPGRPKAE